MKEFQKYIEKYGSRIFLMGLFVFLFHGAKLFSDNIGIDTEDIIKLEDSFYNGWLTTGRQGLVFLKGVLGGLQFNPYFAGVLCLLCLTAGGAAFFFLWDLAAKPAKGMYAGWILGAGLLFSHPVLTEQLYFSLQSVEICLGFLMTAGALFCGIFFEKREKKSGRIVWFAVGALLLVLVFSMYQSFVPLFIFGAVTILLVQGVRGTDESVQTGKRLIRSMFCLIVLFFTGFFVNFVITRLFFSGSDYLGNQIFWGKAGISNNFRLVGGHVVKVLTGYDAIHYHWGYGLLWILAAVLFSVAVCRKKILKREKMLLFFFLLALFLTPFLMTFVCGGAPAVRSQLVLPFLTGFLGWFSVYLLRILWVGEGDSSEAAKGPRKQCRRLKTAAFLAVLISFVTVFSQFQVTARLYYTDDMRYEQDVDLARDIITRIEQVRGRDFLPVVFIGKRPFRGNHACVQGEVIGRSFFDYDTEVEPAFFWSTRRIVGFLHILGQDYAMVTEDKIAQAMEYSTYMPEWPAANSVQVHEGMVVIKLSHYE